MHSLRPTHNRLRRLAGLGPADFFATAVERWEICPAEVGEVMPGIWLPDQVEHISRTEFGALPDILEQMQGNPAEQIPPTLGYRFRDVDFVDGVLHARGAERHLRQHKRSGLGYARPRENLTGALYESWIGNRWFGNWLLNDCLAYRLAEEAGAPVTSAPLRRGHIARYEELLGMAPRRIGDVHFDELVLFDDLQSNSHRRGRAQRNRALVLQGRALEPLPGVFIFRGASGDARILENEAEIAERLEVEYGFRTLYIDRHDADELAQAAGAARIVAGVEGSQLAHGVIAMAPGGTVLTLQPADRVTTSLKLLTDCWQQHYAMVVGSGTARGYRVEWDQIRRTLDLIAAQTA
ncbi:MULTISPECIES: glycosyltransferase family 61 protein [Paracoccus]|uniref:glycosyltransferase family 61 protein n=1 Tax=Paracoccus TaxID=265 RepID=UPI001FB5F38E|nr:MULTISPECIES: glycosyltransferase family 61 protein [Paracoccus]MCJ1900422.1 glycosyltransferase family 61 protein [Paracoccus versutus]MDF3905261.1 glycosyltransferase family 61 protein [Paracoccus sp. AS002]